jgi:5-methylcytosine-specific restriction enzyme subunit McrC
MQPQKAPATIRENHWHLLSDLQGLVYSEEKLRAFQKEVRAKSKRIKHDLGLRYAPLSLEEHDQGWSVRATGIAGTVRIFNTHLQVMPKFVGEEAFIGAWQSSIVTMLDRVRRKQYTYSQIKGISLQKAAFIDHVALAYSDALEVALRQEPIHVYRTREESSPFLRGRFAVGRQMQSFLDRPQRIHCEVDYLETDNQFNQLLHWAGDRLVTMAFDGQVRRRLSETLGRLPSVSLMHTTPVHLRSSIPPQYRHYSEAIEIASVLAKGYAFGQEAGRFSGYGYVLNMEKLFESFVEKSLQHVVTFFGNAEYEVRPQDTHLYAEAFGHGGKSYFTRPDNVLYRDGRPVLLIDAKYKKLSEAEQGDKERPENADIYQVFAALVSHGCDHALLVYPRMLADKDPGNVKVRFWKVSVADRPLLIGAVTLDISNLSSKANLGHFDNKMAELIKDVLETGL